MTSQISRGTFGAVASAALHVISEGDIIYIVCALFAVPIDDGDVMMRITIF